MLVDDSHVVEWWSGEVVERWSGRGRPVAAWAHEARGQGLAGQVHRCTAVVVRDSDGPCLAHAFVAVVTVIVVVVAGAG